MSLRVRAWVVAVLGVGVGTGANAAILHVPDEHPSLTAAVNAARSGDDIELAAGTYSSSTTGEEFPIRLAGRSLHIRGAGALQTRLDAEGAERVLVFVRGDVSVVSDLTLTDGHADDGGAAVLVDGASPTFHRVVITESEATAGGDALQIRGGNAQLVNCLFTANGGPGPTVLVADGAPTFERCTWSTNAGAAMELRGAARAAILHSVVANPGVPTGRGVGLVIMAKGERAGPELADNLFGGCADGAIRVEGEASVELAAMLETARRAWGLRVGEARFVDATRGDFRLRVASASGREVGAFSGSAPLDPPPPAFAAKSEDEGEDVLLGPSVPNPFAPHTTIHFNVPAPSVVDLGVYNILGQRVRTLHAGDLGAGEHTREWDGRDERGEELPPGIYFVRITIGDVTESRRLVLVR